MKNKLFQEFEAVTPTGWAAELQSLERCYDQLLAAAGDPQTDPDHITELSDQAAAIVLKLATLLPTEEPAAVRPRLEQAQQKLHQVMRLVEAAKSQALAGLNELKAGKRAVQSYRSPTVGLGYSEGKFLDQKK